MTYITFRRGDMKKWKDVGYDFGIVKAEEFQEYPGAGWSPYPDGLLKDAADLEPNPKPELEKEQCKKPDRKPKATTDGPGNEG